MANYNEGSDNRLFDKNIRELIGKIFFKNILPNNSLMFLSNNLLSELSL